MPLCRRGRFNLQASENHVDSIVPMQAANSRIGRTLFEVRIFRPISDFPPAMIASENRTCSNQMASTICH
jgi:hypothetical protein